MQKHMPKAPEISGLERMPFPELEELRRAHNISRARLCRRADVHAVTYQRWMRYAAGRPGGRCPLARTLNSVRQALSDILNENELTDQ